jgi:hypothetical protein
MSALTENNSTDGDSLATAHGERRMVWKHKNHIGHCSRVATWRPLRGTRAALRMAFEMRWACRPNAVLRPTSGTAVLPARDPRPQGRTPPNMRQSTTDGRGWQSTALRQDKRRELRPGRTAEEENQINHFARGAFRHRTSSFRASSCKIKITRTLPAATSTTGNRSVAPRAIWPFRQGGAPWQSGAHLQSRTRA